MAESRISRRDWLKTGAVAGLGTVVAPGVLCGRSAPRGSAASIDRARSRLADDLQTIIDETVMKHGMPGAVAGVYRAGETVTAAAGIANLNTGAPMRPDIGFLTGSITKVWTATLMMSFVDEGAIDLATPVRDYLPHVRFRDPEATRTITVRHLLNHTSGVDAGDFILDFGEGPAAHRSFVEAMADLGQIHRPGAYASYCNGGWVLAGHLLEEYTGSTWHRLLTERVIVPLGATRTFTDAEDGALYGVAVGSVPDEDHPGEHMATPKFLLPKTFAPAGATLITTVEDNLRFARMHMRGGVSEDGTRVISERSARAMATRTIDLPTGPASGFGLGWVESFVGDRPMLSHGGGSNGGRALLAALPGADFAYATFVNSSVSGPFQAELQRRIVGELGGDRVAVLGARPIVEPEPTDASGVDRSRFLGVFRRMTLRVVIREEGDKLILEAQTIPEEIQGADAYDIGQPTVFEVVPVSENALGLADDETPTAGWTFLEPREDGAFDLMYASGRLARRIE